MRLIDADTLWHNMETVDWYNNADRDEVAEPLVLRSPTISKWISVKDRLPKSNPDDLEYPVVIIALPDGSVELGCYYESTHEWGAGEWFDAPRKPIAWMPLPEPPKEVEQDG